MGFVLVFKFWILEGIPNLYLRQHNICVPVKISARNCVVFKLKVKDVEKVSHEFKIIKHRLALFTQQSMREVICMKVLGPRHALLAIADIQVFCSKIMNVQETLSRKLNQSSKNWKLGPAMKVPATGRSWAGWGCACAF